MKKQREKKKMIEYLFLVISILSASISVLLFKKLSYKLNFNEGYLVGVKSFINKYSFFIIILVIISIISYTLALSRIPLGFAYAFVNSLNTLLVVLGGILFYKEKIKKKQLIGVILVVLGLFFFSF